MPCPECVCKYAARTGFSARTSHDHPRIPGVQSAGNDTNKMQQRQQQRLLFFSWTDGEVDLLLRVRFSKACKLLSMLHSPPTAEADAVSLSFGKRVA